MAANFILTIRFRWHYRLYINTLIVLCWIFDAEPRPDRLIWPKFPRDIEIKAGPLAT